MNFDKKQLRNTLLLLLGALIWGTAFVAQSVGSGYVGPYTFLAARSWLACAFLLGLMAVLRKMGRTNTAAEPGFWQNKKVLVKGRVVFLRCGAVCGVGGAADGHWHHQHGQGRVMTALYVVLVPVTSIFFGSRPGVKLWSCVVVSVVGLYLLSCMGVSRINKGDLYLMGCALAFSVQITCIDRLAGDLDGLRMNCIQALVVTVLSVPFILLTKETVVFSDITACWFPLVFSGVLSMGVAYTLQIVGQQGLEPTTASLIMSLESVFAALGGWLILHQTMTPWELLGCGLVFAGVVLSQLPVGMFAKKS